jgi:two-component system chemotaxis sensor kinase CheA
MSEFSGMEDMLQEFLQEATELLNEVDLKLVDLERRPDDRGLLNEIFRGFHTIKGGAGFLNLTALVELCHRTENLFDKLRSGTLTLTPEMLDVILAATAAVRAMFDELTQGRSPVPPEAALLSALEGAAEGSARLHEPLPGKHTDIDWTALHKAVAGNAAPAGTVPGQAADGDAPGRGMRNDAERTGIAKDASIRVDTDRLDYVLTLSGEIGLTKNRLTALRNDLLKGRVDAHTLKALDEAVNQLDLMVGNLQNAVMKTRMQPIGRLFRKYPRVARDLARQLGKQCELILCGEDTEIDKTMIEDLNDPLVHLVRNAVDHGVEAPEERMRLGKPAKSEIRLEARQEGDHILIAVSDDGRGMRPEVIRAKAVAKGLISAEEANALDDHQALNLIFLPGFSTKDQASDVSGRGVGMDVVKTNIEKLNGAISIESEPGKGSRFTIRLPLTLAILPVLVVRLGGQPFALPLTLVQEILTVAPGDVQRVGGRPTMVMRGEVLPVLSLADLLQWPEGHAGDVGVVIHLGGRHFVLTVDGFAGRDDVVIKSLDSFRPKGVAGATLSSEGEVVLILDLSQLLAGRDGLIASRAPTPMSLAA